jgi:murein DD-endopeptidase MepM/ murein hydrolase activator NlpD
LKAIFISVIAVMIFLLVFTFMPDGMTNKETLEAYVANQSFMRSKSQLQAYMTNLSNGQIASPATFSGEFSEPLQLNGSTIRLTSQVGPRGSANKLHNGTDIGAPTGTPVSSVMVGAIAEKHEADDNDRGLYIVQGTDPEMWEVIYQHLDRIDVDKDAMIGQGVQVGTVGATDGPNNLSTGPHLHIELIYRPDYIKKFYDAYDIIYNHKDPATADYWVESGGRAIKYNSSGDPIEECAS